MGKCSLNTVCTTDMCCGCMACVESCPQNAIDIVDSLSSYNAVKNSNCVNCGVCNKVCPQNLSIELKKPLISYQGWTIDDDKRGKCASGGFAYEISRFFIKEGGLVCSCCFHDGMFGFSIAEDEDDLLKFIGSKYVKSNPLGIYKYIRKRLSEGSKVLFIGLPCQVAAVKKFVGDKNLNQLFTIDLICHGTPSPKILEQYLSQYKVHLQNLEDVQFREKKKYPDSYKGYLSFSPGGIVDKYSLAFQYNLIFTDNCYNCKYARIERVSDVTLGDSWGASMTEDEAAKGVSLALIQSEKGQYLIENSNININKLDIAHAIRHNEQLNHPSFAPANRKVFFRFINNGCSFNASVYKALKKECLRQYLKLVLIKVGLKKKNSFNYRLSCKECSQTTI